MASIFNKEDKEIVLGNAELQRNFEEEVEQKEGENND